MPTAASLLWPVLSGSLAVAGAALAAWALLWDRSRGRARCPKCWYDLSGLVPSGGTGLRPVGTPSADTEQRPTCPECGRIARREKQLHRTRRRWRHFVAAIALLALAWLILRVPHIRHEGVPGAAPTGANIETLPHLRAADPAQPIDVGSEEYFDEPLRRQAWLALADRLMSEEITEADAERLWRECTNPEPGAPILSDAWNVKYGGLLSATVGGNEMLRRRWQDRLASLVAVELKMCDRIDVDSPILARPEVRHFSRLAADTFRITMKSLTPGVPDLQWTDSSTGRGHRFDYWSDGWIELAPGRSAIELIRYSVTIELEQIRPDWRSNEWEHLGWRMLREYELEAPVPTGLAPGRVLVPNRDALPGRSPPDGLSAALLREPAGDGPRRAWLQIGETAYGREGWLRTPNLTVAGTLVVMRDGNRVAEAAAWWRLVNARPSLNYAYPMGTIVPLTPLSEDLWGFGRDWGVVFTADPAVAARDEHAKEYWEGEMVIPLSVRGWIPSPDQPPPPDPRIVPEDGAKP